VLRVAGCTKIFRKVVNTKQMRLSPCSAAGASGASEPLMLSLGQAVWQANKYRHRIAWMICDGA
jgi:hypothetical protein